MYKKILLSMSVVALLGACSSKKYYEPEESESFDKSSTSISSNINKFNKNYATLEDGHFIYNEGVSIDKIPEDFTLLNYVDGVAIASNKQYELYLSNKANPIKFEDNVIAASIKDSILSLIFSNNTIALYDIEQEKFLFKEYSKESVANDIRIVNPQFMSNIVLFPTLDGKIVVVSLQNYSIVRNVVVDTSDKFNNIIFFQIGDDRLIAATNNKLISVGTNFLSTSDEEIRDIVFDDGYIYFATIDGVIKKLDQDLKVIESKKYKYAKFHSILTDENSVYGIESQGYLVKLSKDFKNENIYDISFDEDKKTFSIKGSFINGKNLFKLD